MVPEDFTITEKAPTRVFSWLKAPTKGQHRQSTPELWCWSVPAAVECPVSGPQINVMFALGRLPGCGHAGLRQGSRAAICTKMQHYGAGTGQDKGWWCRVQDTRRCGGSGNCSGYLSRIFILHKPAIFYVYQPNSSKYQCKLCNNVVIRRLLHWIKSASRLATQYRLYCVTGRLIRSEH